MHLTPTQKRLIHFEPEGVLFIRGQAGSGKTTVLQERAQTLLKAYPKATGLYLTYTDMLAARARKNLQEHVQGGRLTVKTLHDWAISLARKEGLRLAKDALVDNLGRSRFLQHIRQRPPLPLEGHRVATWSDEQWSKEIEWILGQDLPNAEAYLEAIRRGRGRSGGPAKEDRPLVWAIFEQYRRELASKGKYDLHDILGILRAAGETPGSTCDFLFVDEVQDLDLSWLKALASRARVGTSFAGDFAQRIYRRHFTWKAAGIDLPPARSCRLEGTHRNPKPIVELAARVLGEPDPAEDPSFESPTLPLESLGDEHVVLIQEPEPRQALQRAMEYARRLVQEGRQVIVAAPWRKLAEEALERLVSLGVQAQVLTGRQLVDAPPEILPVTTFHQLKGEGYDCVILLGMEDAKIPTWYLSKAQSEQEAQETLAELRNLLHMAMTRAKQRLVLVSGGEMCRMVG